MLEPLTRGEEMAYKITPDKAHPEGVVIYDSSVIDREYYDSKDREAVLVETFVRVIAAFEKAGLKFYKIEKVEDSKY
jgi:hypothetical protein